LAICILGFLGITSIPASRLRLPLVGFTVAGKGAVVLNSQIVYALAIIGLTGLLRRRMWGWYLLMGWSLLTIAIALYGWLVNPTALLSPPFLLSMVPVFTSPLYTMGLATLALYVLLTDKPANWARSEGEP
jgi:hypothetical protein